MTHRAVRRGRIATLVAGVAPLAILVSGCVRATAAPRVEAATPAVGDVTRSTDQGVTGEPTWDRVIEGDRVRSAVVDWAFDHTREGFVLLGSGPLRLRNEGQGWFARSFPAIYPSAGIAAETVLDVENASRLAPVDITISTTDVSVVVVPDSTFLELRDQQPMSPEGYPLRDYWTALAEAYPGSLGVIGLSPAGFNAAGTEALVMITFGCGIECGFEAFVVLDRTGGDWNVRDHRLLNGALDQRRAR
jgi:hypothetical protein